MSSSGPGLKSLRDLDLDLRNLETKDKDRHYLLSSASCPVHVLKSLKTKNAERHYIHPPTPKLFSHKSDSRIANVCLSVCEPNPSASQIQAHLPLCLYLNLLIWYLSDLESLKSVFIDKVRCLSPHPRRANKGQKIPRLLDQCF